MSRKRILIFKTLLLATATAWAHPEDQCEMHVKPAPHALEARFTFNLLTVTKCVRVDADGDGLLSVGELKAAEPAFTRYLNEHIKLKVNAKPAVWGEKAEYHYLWPRFAATPPLGEEEYAGRHLDVTFVLPQEALLEAFSIRFEVFGQTGPRQTIRGIFEQDGQVLEVPLSLQKPQHTYQTGFVAPPSQTPTKPAEAPAAPEPPISPSMLAGTVLAVFLLALGYRHLPKSRRSQSGR
ncbi:MAG: hypothetical protein JNN17_21880 [Verrucomicrobiaceae bacterium]|nr:hypothetical protein [Verrucomicrobiaceae bacterium]